MSELDPVHIDSSHPCVPHRIEELEKELAEARTKIEILQMEDCAHSLHTAGCIGCATRNNRFLQARLAEARAEIEKLKKLDSSDLHQLNQYQEFRKIRTKLDRLEKVREAAEAVCKDADIILRNGGMGTFGSMNASLKANIKRWKDAQAKDDGDGREDFKGEIE